MLELLAPGAAGRWIVAAGADDTFRSLVALKQGLILAEFDRVCERLPGRHRAFAADCERFLGLPEAARIVVLLHPSVVSWVRFAHRTVCLDAAEANLERAADLFREILLAAAVLSGDEIETSLRLDRAGALSLPGTGLILRGVGPANDRVTVRLVHEGRATLSVGGRLLLLSDGDDPGLLKLPSVALDGGAIEVNNRDRRLVEYWVLRVHHGGHPATPLRDEGLPNRAAETARAMQMLASLDEPLAEEVAALMRCLVPVVSPQPDRRVSCSSDAFFGACQSSATDPFELAEELAHEYRHNLLNAVLSFDPVIDDEAGSARLYSPWRDSPRPLVAVLHAIYSFQEVLAVHLSWLDRHPANSVRQQQAALHAARLAYALPALRASCRTTPLGTALLDGLGQRIAPLVDRAAHAWHHFFDTARRQIDDARGRHGTGS